MAVAGGTDSVPSTSSPERGDSPTRCGGSWGWKLSGPLPDETTILNFRHFLEKHKLGQGLLDEINSHLESLGLKLREGTIVDATIIEASSPPPGTGLGSGTWTCIRPRRGTSWHFGMKAHIGVDADTGIVHSMSATAANAHDVTQAHNLLHGGETVVWGDAGYQGGPQAEGEPGAGGGMAGGDASGGGIG